MIEILRKIWEPGWVKASLIAVPASLFFGYIAVLGFYHGSTDIVSIVSDTHPWKKEIGISEWTIFLMSGGGILGLIGLWLRFLLQKKLCTKVSLFNWLVAFLLLAGVSTAFYLLFGSGLDHFFKNLSFIGVLILIFALYALYLAVVTVKPDCSLNPDAHKSRAR